MSLVLASLLLSMGQPVSPSAAASPPQPFVSRRGGRLFISPLGEPFRPKDRDDDALADWFSQTDRNHDGRVTLDEVVQDADRFFTTLDVGKDGEIDPDDITRYENEIAPEILTGRFGLTSLGDGRAGPDGNKVRRGGKNGGFFHVNKDQHQGAGRYGLLDLPEPVVSADTDFNRGVSRNEFRAAAQQRFLALDLDHHGYLTLPALEAIRPAPPATGNPPPRPDDMPIPSPQL